MSLRSYTSFDWMTLVGARCRKYPYGFHLQVPLAFLALGGAATSPEARSMAA